MKAFPWSELIRWYKKNGRHELPWRNYDMTKGYTEHDILYRVWLSEIFLQQTQVSRVIDYFEKVIKRFPTIQTLAQTDYDTFFPYYQGMGYYSRARNILKTARVITEEYNGIFPKEYELLRKLPGVGPYTASAILAFGYGEPYLAWDTNLEKVFSRYYRGRKDIKLTLIEKKEIEENFQHYSSRFLKDRVVSSFGTKGRIQESETLGPSQSSGGRKKDIVRDINNALMDFAALVDLKNPEQIDWENYPIQCGLFYETRGNLEPKEMKKSVYFPTPDATVVVTLHKDHRVYYSAPSFVISSGGDSRSREICPAYEEHGADVSFHSTGQSRNYIMSSESSVIPADAGILGDDYENRFRHKAGMTETDKTGQEPYTPFFLPPALHRDTRKYVQDYFRTNYALEVSVRPVHKKWIDEDGNPYIALNAQIQKGTPKFEEYRKMEGIFVVIS